MKWDLGKFFPKRWALEEGLSGFTLQAASTVFLSIRGMCQREAGHVGNAAETFTAAARLAPGCASYRAMADRLASEAAGRKLTTTHHQQNTL